MKMRKTVGILLFAPLFALWSCEKNGEFSTTYNITARVQFENGGDSFLALNAKAYVYYGDTTQWRVASWEDACEGIVTSKEDGTRLEPVFEAEPDNDYRMVMGPLAQEQIMLLVCYTQPADVAGAKMYAWRNARIIDDLPNVYVDLTFKPWREVRYYSESRWAMYNDRWIAEPDTD